MNSMGCNPTLTIGTHGQSILSCQQSAWTIKVGSQPLPEGKHGSLKLGERRNFHSKLLLSGSEVQPPDAEIRTSGE
jgi:hypothetical protein